MSALAISPSLLFAVPETEATPYYTGQLPKTCSCGRVYSAEQWAELDLCGTQPMEADPLDERPEAHTLELRNCECGSTIAVAVRR